MCRVSRPGRRVWATHLGVGVSFQVFSTEMFGEVHPQCSLSYPPQRIPLQVLR